MGSKFERYLKDQEEEMIALKKRVAFMDRNRKENEAALNVKRSEIEKLAKEIEYLKNEKMQFQKKLNEYPITPYLSLESKMRLHSVKSHGANTKVAKQAESVVQISEDNDVQMVDRNTKEVRHLDMEAENKDLRVEVSKMKEEKCILINKLFSTSSKYEHLKKVRSIYFTPAKHRDGEEVQQGHQRHQGAQEAGPDPDGNRAAGKSSLLMSRGNPPKINSCSTASPGCRRSSQTQCSLRRLAQSSCSQRGTSSTSTT